MAFPQRVKDQIRLLNPSDEELVSAYVDQGDERAFRMLVERHQERVFGFLFGMVRDRTVANDLFQETYIRVISALQNQRASYSQQGRFLGWVLRIARNAALDHLRTRKRWQDVSANTDDLDSSFWDRLPDNGLSSDVELHNTEQESFVRQCIDELPAEQREVLLLRHEADLTFREIAELTDCSINTALGRMRYALHNLRRIMVSSDKVELSDFGA
ncbi:MAG: sigma-70 family RNA polymerase sigma factor [Bacteroidetes bacterium]|nr:MAG: sigma-70 family RNA polymerase sigma factor [Bacteroidota bacterium]